MSSIQTVKLETDRPQRLTRQQIRYQRRKKAGLCAYGTCTSKTSDGHVSCNQHLRQMSDHVSDIYQSRKQQKICRLCGTRPQFWGTRCVICRQLVAKDPLPRAARTALRRYHEKEAQNQQEKNRESIRIAARELVAGGSLTVREKEALSLYLGLEDDDWRTYRQVASLMHLSVERVRQLLVRSKTVLAQREGVKVPWRTRRAGSNDGFVIDILGIGYSSQCCDHRKSKSLLRLSTSEAPHLSSVVLKDVPIVQCNTCKGYHRQIPHRAKLYLDLAKALLCKSDLLSGQELRFLRKAVGLKRREFSEFLNVTVQTVQYWETRSTLRAANDIAARIVLASHISSGEDSSSTFKLPKVIPSKKRKPSVIKANWSETLGRWNLSSD